MLELARQGAVWLREYEGWGAGASAPVIEEGQEPPEMLRHLEHQVSDAREVGLYFLPKIWVKRERWGYIFLA